MEHRYAQRKSVELKVWLTGSRFEKRPARVRNLSLDGVFIETFKDSLPTGSFVSISVPPGHAGAQRDCCLGALVVHSKGNGAGLMFSASRSERRSLLNDVLADVIGLPEDGGKVWRSAT